MGESEAVSPCRALTVVVVDDDDDIRLLARAAVERDRRLTVVAEGRDGNEAIALARMHQPDLVLLDLEMPWLDGAEAVPQILREAPASVVALWTVAPQSRRAVEAMDLGASALLDKAFFSTGQLADALVELVTTARRCIAPSTR